MRDVPTLLTSIQKNAGSTVSSASTAPYTASTYEMLGGTIELKRLSISF